MDAQSQNMQDKRDTAVNTPQAANDLNTAAQSETGKQRKKYHKNALYAARMSRDSVGHVKPHNHTGLDL